MTAISPNQHADGSPRDCICADPENCTQPVPGRLCRKLENAWTLKTLRDGAPWNRMAAGALALIERLQGELAAAEAGRDEARREELRLGLRVAVVEGRLAEAEKDAEAKQARIDELMLEYCACDMTEEQVARWGQHQRPVSPEDRAAIDAALSPPRGDAQDERDPDGPLSIKWDDPSR